MVVVGHHKSVKRISKSYKFLPGSRWWSTTVVVKTLKSLGRAIARESQTHDVDVCGADVGWNARRLIFHERSGSAMKTKNTRGNHKGAQRETLKPTRLSHTCARSSKHKRRYKIHDQQRTIQMVTGLLPEEVLMVFSVRRSWIQVDLLRRDAAVSLME